MKKGLFTLTLFAVIVGGCGLFKKISYQNVSYLYNFTTQQKTPEYLVFHTNDSISTLYFKVNTSHLMYEKSDANDYYCSRFNLKIELYENYQLNTPIDSFSREYSDTSYAFQNKELIFGMDFTLKNSDCILKVTFSDYNQHFISVSYINIYKKNKFSRQNFVLLDTENVPLFKNILPKNQAFKIRINDSFIKKLYVNCYFREFPIAGPPFSNPKEKPFALKADSNYVIDVSNGSTQPMTLKRMGIYHFRKDTSSNDGISVFHFYADFPKITTPVQMLLPLRYITSKKEYNDLVLLKDKKPGIDAFWIQVAGNSEKAKELIRKYYNLVQEANLYFSSYHEGWKTDRGIIYIVYGRPGVVYKSNNTETWIYGEANNHLSTRFYFYKVTNCFSDNDYSLNKSETYRESWYMALNLWRKQ